MTSAVPEPDAEQRREPRELNPVSFSLTNGKAFDQDWSVQPVRADDVHPSEVESAPKADDALSAPESATLSSVQVSPTESGATAEKASGSTTPEVPVGLEDLVPDSSKETSAGVSVPPAVTPPSPPVPTPSSRSAAKSV